MTRRKDIVSDTSRRNHAAETASRPQDWWPREYYLRYIEANSTPEPNTGCRLWLKGMGEYASLGVNGEHTTVPRFLLGLEPGDPLHACHRCDNHYCVERGHLFAGTRSDNMSDMRRKGRHGGVKIVARRTHCPQGHPYAGENVRVAKNGQRVCLACSRIKNAEYQASGRRKEQRRERARLLGRAQV